MADTEASRLQHQRHTGLGRRALNAVSIALIAAVPLLASTASAQQCDPAYGCNPSTTAPSSPAPTCNISGTVAAEGQFAAAASTHAVTGGQVLSATVVNAPAGAAITITVGGILAGSGAADAAGSATISFTVPEGLAPGTYAVFAVGAGFSCSCGEVAIGGVGSNVIENPQPGAGGSARWPPTTSTAASAAGRSPGRASRSRSSWPSRSCCYWSVAG